MGKNMTSIDSLYRKEDGYILIEIKLPSVLHLFNSFDPAPFYTKELDRDASDYIVGIVRDFPLKTQFRIIVYLPTDALGTQEAQKIPEAIRNHFKYMVLVQGQKLRERCIYGKFTLLVGLSFLAIAMIASQAVAETFSNYPLARLFAIALEVAGWVAMWEPVTVHLYQLWPIIKERKIYEKISRLEVEVRPYP